MPYNVTPIAPPTEYTGQVSLPLARTKKIIAADDDIHSCSNNAAFVITIATEMFIQHLVKQSYEIKSDKRQRKNLAYNDLANAIARVDNLEFLTDVVPKTTTYKKLVAEKGADFKPGPQVELKLLSDDMDDDINGEGPSNTGLPSNVKDLMNLTADEAPIQNGGQTHDRQEQIQRDGDDVIMGEVSHAQTNGAAPASDPIQEQLAMEMAFEK